MAAGLGEGNRGAGTPQQPCRERRHLGSSEMGRGIWSQHNSLPNSSPWEKHSPLSNPEPVSPLDLYTWSKTLLYSPGLPASATHTSGPLAGTVPWSEQVVPMCFHPRLLSALDFQVMTEGGKEGCAGSGTLVGKGAWILRNIKGLRSWPETLCCAPLHLPSTMVMSGGQVWAPYQLYSLGAWGWGLAPRALLRPTKGMKELGKGSLIYHSDGQDSY